MNKANKKQAKKHALTPEMEEKKWKAGESGNPNGRPKGKRNFKTDFEMAAREVAKALKLGDKPDPIYIELMKKGITSGLKGNYNFWKDIAERLYGKETEKIEHTQSQETIMGLEKMLEKIIKSKQHE